MQQPESEINTTIDFKTVFEKSNQALNIYLDNPYQPQEESDLLGRPSLIEQILANFPVEDHDKIKNKITTDIKIKIQESFDLLFSILNSENEQLIANALASFCNYGFLEQDLFNPVLTPEQAKKITDFTLQKLKFLEDIDNKETFKDLDGLNLRGVYNLAKLTSIAHESLNDEEKEKLKSEVLDSVGSQTLEAAKVLVEDLKLSEGASDGNAESINSEIPDQSDAAVSPVHSPDLETGEEPTSTQTEVNTKHEADKPRQGFWKSPRELFWGLNLQKVSLITAGALVVAAACGYLGGVTGQSSSNNSEVTPLTNTPTSTQSNFILSTPTSVALAPSATNPSPTASPTQTATQKTSSTSRASQTVQATSTQTAKSSATATLPSSTPTVQATNTAQLSLTNTSTQISELSTTNTIEPTATEISTETPVPTIGATQAETATDTPTLEATSTAPLSIDLDVEDESNIIHAGFEKGLSPEAIEILNAIDESAVAILENPELNFTRIGNTPYEFGGKNLISGIDCSGLVYKLVEGNGPGINSFGTYSWLSSVNSTSENQEVEVLGKTYIKYTIDNLTLSDLDKLAPGTIILFPTNGLTTPHMSYVITNNASPVMIEATSDFDEGGIYITKGDELLNRVNSKINAIEVATNQDIKAIILKPIQTHTEVAEASHKPVILTQSSNTISKSEFETQRQTLVPVKTKFDLGKTDDQMRSRLAHNLEIEPESIDIDNLPYGFVINSDTGDVFTLEGSDAKKYVDRISAENDQKTLNRLNNPNDLDYVSKQFLERRITENKDSVQFINNIDDLKAFLTQDEVGYVLKELGLEGYEENLPEGLRVVSLAGVISYLVIEQGSKAFKLSSKIRTLKYEQFSKDPLNFTSVINFPTLRRMIEDFKDFSDDELLDRISKDTGLKVGTEAGISQLKIYFDKRFGIFRRLIPLIPKT